MAWSLRCNSDITKHASRLYAHREMALSQPKRSGTVRVKAVLVAGYLALTIAIAGAIATPPTGYEVSIYAGTPISFWAGIGIAALIALAVGMSPAGAPVRTLAVTLGGTSVFALTTLPLVRGYTYYGWHDPMTHLGWARDVAVGTSDPNTIIYPAIHVVAAFLNRMLGLPLTRTMLLTVALFFLVYLLFVPLILRVVTDDPRAVTVGVFAAGLMLPITNLSTHPHAHPFTQTTLLSAMALFLLVVYLGDPDTGGLVPTSGIGVLFVLTLLSLVVYHPQEAANVLLALGAIGTVQFLARRFDHSVLSVARDHAPIYVPTVLFGAFFVFWTSQSDLLVANVVQAADSVAAVLAGHSDAAAASVRAQSTSLSRIGASLPVIFLKLFLPAVVFLVLAGAAVRSALRGRLAARGGLRRSVVLYLAVALVPLAGLFVVHLVGGVSEMYFRHLGYIFVIITLLGAITMTELIGGASGGGRRRATRAVTVLFVILIPLASAVLFPSPYIHKSSQQVTEAKLDGYERAFELTTDDAVAGVRSGPWREHDAIAGTAARPSTPMEYGVSGENMSRLRTSIGDPSYFAYAQHEYERETGPYRELRYSREDFRSLRSQPGVDRVMTNGDVRLFHVD